MKAERSNMIGVIKENKNNNRRWFAEKDNCRLLVPTLNKTNQNVSAVMGIIFLNNKGIVFRKVDTLMEVRNMNEINKKPKRRETSLQSDVCSLMMAVIVSCSD